MAEARRCGTVPSGTFVCPAGRVLRGTFAGFMIGSLMAKLSAGLLLYRHNGDAVEILIAHPGGPIWARRDTAAWSLPKGAPLDQEDLLVAARREFHEETGYVAPDGRPIDLGEVRMRSGKTVRAWAIEGNMDPATLRSLEVEVEWPPRTGQVVVVPEIDRIVWARPAEARRRLNPAQAEFVDRLLAALARA